MNSHQDLFVWQKSMSLVESVYKVTENFPAEEKFNLTSQIRRSAVSIPSNISEGHGRGTDGDFSHFLRIAYGSSAELETQIILANRLKLIAQTDMKKIIAELTEVRKMLNKLIGTVSKSQRLITKS